MASCEPLRILSLDGGGIRGISSLLILENVMERIRDAKHLDQVPRPCEYFDLIGGTSTGGIIAIMLGRLGMTVDECIRAYRKVAQQAFTPKRNAILPARPSGAFSATALEAAIKQTIREFCREKECVTRQRQGFPTAVTCRHADMAFRDSACTKTVVLAITKDNVDAPPTLFKTYDTSAAFNGCTIWQVARATSAATTFFKSIMVGRDAIEFVDAGFGYNNPCEILIQEGQRQFPGRQQMRVLSIGTGLGDVVTIRDNRLSIINALKKMATSSKKVAASLDGQFGDTGQYYRFNVDHGLQDITLSDWKKASKISAHTRKYLTDNERRINKFIDNFTSMSLAGEGHIDGISQIMSGDRGGSRHLMSSRAEGQAATTRGKLSETPLNRKSLPCYTIPFLRNRRFVGRERTLSELKQKLFIDRESQKVAVSGLGGVGKTQVALQLAYWVKEHMPDYSIFWVSALSDESFEQAYTEIARKLAVRRNSDSENIMEPVRRQLSSEAAGPWFLIVDNADDLELLFGSQEIPGGISQYLPESERGVTLFTTRSRGMAVSVAGSDVIELLEMDLQEATYFLEKALVEKDSLHDKEGTAHLLNELCCLPLAIMQAAAYLNTTGISISKYLEMLRSTERDMISLMSRQFHDNTRYRGSQNAIAKTWLVSFDQIRKSDSAAADLLSFISCIEPKAIPRSILPKLEMEELMVHAIGTLCGYGFMVDRGDNRLFDIHSLVHLAARIWVDQEGVKTHTVEKVMCHLEVIFPSYHYTNRILWREYMPHAFEVLRRSEGSDKEETYSLYLKVGHCLQADGRIKEAVRCFEKCHRWRKDGFLEDHPDRLISQHDLARAYHADGQIKKAVQLLEHVVMVEGILAEDHPDRLASQHELARAYHADGQIKKAVQLLEHVAAVEERAPLEDQ